MSTFPPAPNVGTKREQKTQEWTPAIPKKGRTVGEKKRFVLKTPMTRAVRKVRPDARGNT